MQIVSACLVTYLPSAIHACLLIPSTYNPSLSFMIALLIVHLAIHSLSLPAIRCPIPP